MKSLWACAAQLVWGAAAVGGPIAIGGSAYKDHFVVTETPKYSSQRPWYFTAANVVATSSEPFAGAPSGVMHSTVYLLPGSDWLAFEYRVQADAGNTQAIEHIMLGGAWEGVIVGDAGADASGLSGSGDGLSEWFDGDPYFMSRLLEGTPIAQWELSGLGSQLGAGDMSALIWLETDATQWALSTGTLRGGGTNEVNAPMLGPTSAPAPGVMGALLIGVGLWGARRRR
ncbi:MAG: hypothetical protein H7Y88_13750 [Phycisphaerales bacterium]|nr:hypothetical protein [Phycisphaerales bacterium]